MARVLLLSLLLASVLGLGPPDSRQADPQGICGQAPPGSCSDERGAGGSLQDEQSLLQAHLQHRKGGQTLASEATEAQQPCVLKPGVIVNLKGGSTGKFCTDRLGSVSCTSDVVGLFERFELIDAGAGNFALRGLATRGICSDTGVGLECNRLTALKGESFKLQNYSGNMLSLQGLRANTYCSDAAKLVSCTKTTVGPAEKFVFACEPPRPQGTILPASTTKAVTTTAATTAATANKLATLAPTIARTGLSVVCSLRVQGKLLGVRYNGVDITATVNGSAESWPAPMTVPLQLVPGAYLVVLTEAERGDCGGGGFQISCPGLDLGQALEVFGSRSALPATDPRVTGAGTGWTSPVGFPGQSLFVGGAGCDQRVSVYAESTGSYLWGGRTGDNASAQLTGKGEHGGKSLWQIPPSQWMGVEDGCYRILNSQGLIEHYWPIAVTGATAYFGKSSRSKLLSGALDGQALNSPAFMGSTNGAQWYASSQGGMVKYSELTETHSLTTAWTRFSGGGELAGRPAKRGVGLLDFAGNTAISNGDNLVNIDAATGVLEYYSAVTGTYQPWQSFSSWRRLVGGDLHGLTLLTLKTAPSGRFRSNSYRFLGNSNDDLIFAVCLAPWPERRVASYSEASGAYFWGGARGNARTAYLGGTGAEFSGRSLAEVRPEQWVGIEDGCYRILNSEGLIEHFWAINPNGVTSYLSKSQRAKLYGGPLDGQPLRGSSFMGSTNGAQWYANAGGGMVKYTEIAEIHGFTSTWTKFSGGGDLAGRAASRGLGLLDFGGNTVISNGDYLANVNSATGTLEYYSVVTGAYTLWQPFSSWTALTGGDLAGLTLRTLAQASSGIYKGSTYAFLGNSNDELLFLVSAGQATWSSTSTSPSFWAAAESQMYPPSCEPFAAFRVKTELPFP